MSVSRIPLRKPRRANAMARFAAFDQTREFKREEISRPAIVDLPTPPFAEDTAITFLTSLIGRLSGSPLCKRGMLPVFGSPWIITIN